VIGVDIYIGNTIMPIFRVPLSAFTEKQSANGTECYMIQMGSNNETIRMPMCVYVYVCASVSVSGEGFGSL
jgi:hypothetical protein